MTTINNSQTTLRQKNTQARKQNTQNKVAKSRHTRFPVSRLLRQAGVVSAFYEFVFVNKRVEQAMITAKNITVFTHAGEIIYL